MFASDENNPEIIKSMRQLKRQGKTSADILYCLDGCNLKLYEKMYHFGEAFNLDFWDVSCIGGWFPDGSGELSDEQICSLLEPAIARKWSELQ